VIQAVTLRPLPYKNPKGLVLLTDSQDPVSGAFLFKDIKSFKSVSRRRQRTVLEPLDNVSTLARAAPKP